MTVMLVARNSQGGVAMELLAPAGSIGNRRPLAIRFLNVAVTSNPSFCY